MRFQVGRAFLVRCCNNGTSKADCATQLHRRYRPYELTSPTHPATARLSRVSLVAPVYASRHRRPPANTRAARLAPSPLPARDHIEEVQRHVGESRHQQPGDAVDLLACFLVRVLELFEALIVRFKSGDAGGTKAYCGNLHDHDASG